MISGSVTLSGKSQNLIRETPAECLASAARDVPHGRRSFGAFECSAVATSFSRPLFCAIDFCIILPRLELAQDLLVVAHQQQRGTLLAADFADQRQ